MNEVSTLRLYLLRVAYLMITVFLLTQIWPALVLHKPITGMMHGVARCLLAAMAPLMALGIRYPVKMLPILLFELFWKAIWVIAFGLPLRSAHQFDADSAETMKACVFGVILCLIVIPWPYVFRRYVTARGERWK